MKKITRRFLTLLPLLPLVMANSPLPEVFSESYKDFKLTFVSEEETSDGRFQQRFTLENTGKGYIDRIYLDDVYSLDFYGSYMNYSDPYPPFYSSVFEPGYSGEIIMTSSSKMPDFRKVTPKAEGYSDIVKDLPVEGTKEITAVSGNSDYYYQIDLGLKIPDTYYEYGAILKLDYKGVTCYIEVSESRNYQFQTTEELELDKLTVLDVIGIKSEPYLTHQLGGCVGGFSNFLKMALIVFAIFFLIISFGVFSAIFFPAMARRRRRNREKLAQENKK